MQMNKELTNPYVEGLPAPFEKFDYFCTDI